MLRSALLIFSCVLTIVGVFRLFAGDARAWPMAAWGLVLLLAVIFERWRYQKKDDAAGGEWQATDERFIDPETGREVQVFYQAATGKRRYVPVGNSK
jgi:hypothetical protein